MRDNDIQFLEEYQPLEDRFYAADIAFPDLGLIIEINGRQHYNKDGTLAKYYQERHNLISAEGWHILEILFELAYNDDFVNQLIVDIKTGGIMQYKKFIFGFDTKMNLIDDINRAPRAMELLKRNPKYKVCPKCEIVECNFRAKMCSGCTRINSRKVVRPSYGTLKGEVDKLGYVGTGRKYGVSDSAIRKWMKYYERDM